MHTTNARNFNTILIIKNSKNSKNSKHLKHLKHGGLILLVDRMDNAYNVHVFKRFQTDNYWSEIFFSCR